MRDPGLFWRLLLALFVSGAGVLPRASLAQAPSVTLSVSSLTFADEYPLYYTSPPMSVTLTNSGTTSLTISSISLGGANPGDFTITAGGSASTLDPGGSQTITLTFKPTTVGSRTATLSVASDAASSPDMISLAGNGLEPAFEIAVNGGDPMAPSARLTFPDTMVGLTNPVVKTISITNVGTGSGSFLAIGWTSGAGFAVVSDTGQSPLLPGQSRTFTVAFSPSSVGTNYANLVATVRDDYRGAEISAVITCYGNGLPPAVTVSPTSLDFGGVVKGTTGPPRSVTLTNNQSGSLSVTGISLTGANPGDFNIAGGGSTGSLGPGASQAITLTFTPTAFGGRSATLVITTDAPDSPHIVSMVGNGQQPSLQIQMVGTDPNPSTALLAFPDTPVGTTSPILRTFGVKNVGTASGTVCCLYVGNASFQLVAESGPTVILPGETHSFTFSFTPSIVGSNYTYLSLQVNDNYQVGVYKPASVLLIGNGLAPPTPSVTLSPASLSFGSQAVGTTSTARTITLTNTGNAPLTLNSITLGGANPGNFAIVSGGGAGTLAPGASQSVGVTFSPSAATTYSTALEVTDTAPGSPHQVPLDGIGFVPTPAVNLTPLLDFGNQLVGTTSAPQNVTLSNSGTGPLTISSISLVGANPGSFSITSGGSAGTLAPGSSRSIGIAFSPGVAGSLSASLTITDDAAGSPHQVSLTGTGVPPAPAVSLSPTSLDFGYQAVGTTSAARSVTLTNSGTGPLTVSSISLGGASPGSFAIAGGGSAGTLAPGASQSISLTFAPASTGSFSASLTVVSDAAGSPHRVSLIGAGGAAALSVSPTSLDFGSLDLGRTVTQGLALTNTGTAPLSISSIDRSGDPDFGIVGGGAMSLQPGESRSLTVSFAPGAVGPRHGLLAIHHNAGSSPAIVSLTGTGTNPPPPPPGTPLARVIPGSLEFGQQAVGTTGAAQRVILANPGTGPLVISSVSLAGANPGEFRLIAGSPGTVTAGGQISIQISFAPTTAGARSALLLIRHNASSSPDTVTLTGTGTPGSSSTPSTGPPVITGYAATNPRGVRIFSAPPGAPLLILGQNLGTSGTLAFNGIPAPPALSWSPTEIVAIVPAAPSYAFTGPVTATVMGQSALGPPFTITLPKIAAVPSADWPVFMHDPRQLGLADSAPDPTKLAPWSVPLGAAPASAPVVRGGVAYIGTQAGDVFAIDMATHAVRWQQRLPSGVRAAPAAGDTAIVVSAGGLYGLSPADGKILWHRLDLIPNDGVAPMLVGSTVYVGARVAGSPNRIIYALDVKIGAGIWPLAFTLSPGLDTRATAAAFPELDLLLVGLGPPATDNPPSTGPGSVIALRLADGTAAWPAPAALPNGPPPNGLSLGWAAAGTGVQPALFAATGGTVSARNAVTSEVIWNRSLPESTLLGPPVVSATAAQSTTLYVGGASGHLYALNSSTGADAGGAWASSPPVTHPLVGPLALAGSYLYAPAVDGLSVFDVGTGKHAWSSPLTAASSVAIAAGAPSLTTTDNLFVGFSVGSITPPPPTVVHDVAISQIKAPQHVSRQSDAQVQVTVTNRGTQAETCDLLLRVQPGRVIIARQPVSLAAGEAKTLTIPWPTPLMGEDGPKTLVAELSLEGQTDSSPGNNQAVQVVIVGL